MDALCKITIDSYNKIAKDYADTRIPTFWLDEYNVFKKLLKGKKVIDVGCGTGRDAALFVCDGFDYIGIDASSGMLKEARDRVEGAQFREMDFCKLNFAKEEFDGFWMSAAVLHVPKKDAEKFLKDIRKITKYNGIGFISLQGNKDKDEEIKKENSIERYFAYYGKDEFVDLLRGAGFEIISSYAPKKEDNKNWLCYFVGKNQII